jgi:hypothetical protein
MYQMSGIKKHARPGFLLRFKGADPFIADPFIAFGTVFIIMLVRINMRKKDVLIQSQNMHWSHCYAIRVFSARPTSRILINSLNYVNAERLLRHDL